MWRRVLPLWSWSFLIWILLSWTATIEQFTVGLAVSLLVALACATLGTVAGPWTLIRPTRVRAAVSLIVAVSSRVVASNWALTRLIWSGRPIPSGMLVVPTRARTDGELASVGILTSLIVNSQLVDLDRNRHELQYHAVAVTTLDPDSNRDRINSAVEARIFGVTRR